MDRGNLRVQSDEMEEPEDIPDVADPWGTAAVRHALGRMASAKVPTSLVFVRVNPLPIEGPAQSLHALCFGPQSKLDTWRNSDPMAPAILQAVLRWIEGRFLYLGSALAATTPLPGLLEALLDVLPIRERDILMQRLAGVSLEALAESQNASVERIQHREALALETMAVQVMRLRSIDHPLVLALFGHVRLIASRIPQPASDDWIRNSFPPLEASCLILLFRIRDSLDKDIQPFLDPFAPLEFSSAAPITDAPAPNAQVEALRTGFLRLLGHRRWVRMDEVCALTRQARATVVNLARFAGLTLHGDVVLNGHLLIDDVKREILTGLLEDADRALHEAEILEGFLGFGFSGDSTLRDIQRVCEEHPDIFVSNGRGLWQVRTQRGGTVEDRRPLPPLPSTPGAPERRPALGTLVGLDPQDPEFALYAGEHLARALAHHPEGRVSQVLQVGDTDKLLAWLRIATPRVHTGTLPDGTWPARILEGLTLLAACVAAVQGAGPGDGAPWTAIMAACGQAAHAWIFDHQQVPRPGIRSRWAEVVTLLLLKRGFSLRSDPWSGLIVLQAGL